jgi:Arc/MetJ-type ribon-helix-helix transcriptional regulator
MKARLTITLDARLLATVDRAVGRAPELDSRSAVIEEAVRRWSRVQYEASIREYYAGRSEIERLEDDSWAELSAAELAATVARDAPAPAARGRKPTQRRRRKP